MPLTNVQSACPQANGRPDSFSLSEKPASCSVEDVSKSLACRLGRHHWAVEQRQIDRNEPPRTVRVCTRCQTTSFGGSRFEHTDLPNDPNGTGAASGFAGGGGGF